MSSELKNILLDMVDALKGEIEELNEEIEALSYRVKTTKSPKELRFITEQLDALQI